MAELIIELVWLIVSIGKATSRRPPDSLVLVKHPHAAVFCLACRGRLRPGEAGQEEVCTSCGRSWPTSSASPP